MNTYRYNILNFVLTFCITAGLAAQNSIDTAVYTLLTQSEKAFGSDALPGLEKALDLCSLPRTCADSTMGRIYHRLSVAYFQGYIDDLYAVSFADSSITYYERAYGINHPLVANGLYNKGIMQSILGKYYDASRSIKTGIDRIKEGTLKSIERDSILSLWYRDLAIANSKIGDFKMGIENTHLALQYAHYWTDSTNLVLGTFRLNLGYMYLEQGIIDLAIENLREAISPFLRHNHELYLSNTYTNIGLCHLHLNKLDSAHFYYTVATELLLKSNINHLQKEEQLGNLYSNFMLIHLRNEDWKQANEQYTLGIRSISDCFSNDRYPVFSEFYLQKAMVEQGQNNLEEALIYCDKALSVVTPQFSNPLDINNFVGPTKRALAILAFRARILQDMGRLEEALAQYELLSDFVTQTRRGYQANLSKYYLIQKVQPAYERAIALCRRLYAATGEATYREKAYAFNARNKAILLLEALQSERAMQFGGIPAEVLAREAELRQAVIDQEAALYHAYQNDEPMDSLELVLFGKQDQYRDFIRQLERDYPAFYALKYAANEPPAIADLQAALEPDRALLEYFVGQDSIYTFRFTNNDYQVFTRPVPAGFQDSVYLLRELMTNGISEDCEATYIRLGRYFYDLLVADALEDLPGGVSRLLIVPDGLLNFLSFEALVYRPLDRLAGAQGMLVERFAFSYAYASKLLLEPPPSRPDSPRIFGGYGLEYDDATLNYLNEVAFDKHERERDTFPLPCGLQDTSRYLGPLRFSDDEVIDIARLLRGDSYTNRNATKPTFLRSAGDYRLLHLATHGSYDLDYPMNSSVVFSMEDTTDIFLRAAEIFGLEFAADMIVLSACNTGYGKLAPGEGAMTLARAFHYAGIPSVVATLWSVPDRSTARIMQAFYEHLADGLPKDEALRQAKLAFLADDDLSSPVTRRPVHWAPTVIIGDVSPISLPQRRSWWWLAGVGALGLGILGYRRVRVAA